jgi:general secretion pathway protein B
MSLILDALKKSEAERQRQAGPTLLEVRVARPQRRYPLWALAVGILLAINMILLLVFVLRPSDNTRTLNPASAPALAAAPAPPAANPAPAAAPAAAPAPLPSAPQSVTAQLAPPPATAPTLVGSPNDDASNPADDEPAIAATPGNIKAQRESARIDYSALPSVSEVANAPDLRLDLHVYAERARDRYALINMQTVHEGEALSEGPRVLAITRDGVALEWHGQQFMLRPQ